MIMVSFRTKYEKDDMIHKAKKMKEFADEFLDCLERGEEEYDYDERRYRDDQMHEDAREDRSYRRGMRSGRYSY